jgi:large subunit ribosomal protein L9
MKVFLTKKVPGVGEANQVIDVADGYALNYLLPRKLAVRATEGQINAAKQYAENQARRSQREHDRSQQMADTLAKTSISFKVKAGETGRLYGSITSADVAERLSSAVGEEFDRRWIVLDRPIRNVGEHIVDLKLGGGVRGHVKVIVESIED